MNDYRDLAVWQKATDLVMEVYKIIRRLPKEEVYALTEQLRRAVVSIPSNIAEGYGRGATKDYCRFLSIARGSKYEVETQLLICVRLGYVGKDEVVSAMSLCDEIGKMLNSIIIKLMPNA